MRSLPRISKIARVFFFQAPIITNPNIYEDLQLSVGYCATYVNFEFEYSGVNFEKVRRTGQPCKSN